MRIRNYNLKFKMQTNSFKNSSLKNTIQQRQSLFKNPVLKSGFSLLFDHKVPIQMKYMDYDRNIKPLGSNQIINFKIYTLGMKPNITNVKIEIDSDGDPFFSSIFQTDQTIFETMREDQKFNFDFQEFPTILIKSLNKIQEIKGKVSASMLIHSDGKCKLTLWHSSEFKNIQIVTLEFNQQNETDVQTKASIKYENLRKKLVKTEERLAKIYEIIKEKNPSLLMQLSKTTEAQYKASKN